MHRGFLIVCVLMVCASSVWAVNKSPASCEPKMVHSVVLTKRDYATDGAVARKTHEDMITQLAGIADDGVKPASDVFVQADGSRLAVSGKAMYVVPSYDAAYALWDKARALGYNVRITTKNTLPRGKCAP